MGQSHFGDGFLKGFHEQPGNRGSGCLAGVLKHHPFETYAQRQIESSQKKHTMHLVFFKRPPARKYVCFGIISDSIKATQTHTHTLMTDDCPIIKFLCRIFIHCFLCTPAKQKDLPPKKSRTFRWSFASSQVLQRQPQLNHSLKSCRPVSIGLGVKQYPVFGAIGGGFKRISGCYRYWFIMWFNESHVYIEQQL